MTKFKDCSIALLCLWITGITLWIAINPMAYGAWEAHRDTGYFRVMSEDSRYEYE